MTLTVRYVERVGATWMPVTERDPGSDDALRVYHLVEANTNSGYAPSALRFNNVCGMPSVRRVRIGALVVCHACLEHLPNISTTFG